MSFQFGGGPLGYTPTDITDQNHPYHRIGQGFVVRAQKDAQWRQNADRAPMAPIGGDVMKMQAPSIPQFRPQSSGAVSLNPQDLQAMQGGLNQLYKGWFTGDGPSLWERMQGWGADLGSRMGQGGKPAPYSLESVMRGGTPTGGLY